MKTTVTVICPDALAAGFNLAGAEVIGVDSPEEAESALVEKLRSRRWGLVLVAREIMDAIPERVRAAATGSTMPVFLDVPLSVQSNAEEDEARAREYVESMLQAAVGKRIAIVD